jgi:hypothetical protein
VKNWTIEVCGVVLLSMNIADIMRSKVDRFSKNYVYSDIFSTYCFFDMACYCVEKDKELICKCYSFHLRI